MRKLILTAGLAAVAAPTLAQATVWCETTRGEDRSKNIQVAKDQPCPQGYVRREIDDGPPPRPICRWVNQTYRDDRGVLVHRQIKVCR
jgi:hypothetical protein